MISPGCGRHEKIPTFASNPELARRPAGPLWKTAMSCSRASEYVELPSSNRDPVDPSRGVASASAWRNCALRGAEVDKDKKSLDEKSTEPIGLAFRFRSLDSFRLRWSNCSNLACKDDLDASSLSIGDTDGGIGNTTK